MKKIMLAGLIAVAFTTASATASESVTASEKILLQATMQQAIDRHLVDGNYLYFDEVAAEVRTLHPTRTHPMILSMGDHFILCADFRTGNGAPVNIDFYVARDDDKFVVFDTVVDNREPIQRLMSTGMARAVD
jgi:hypothetical protein